MKESLNVWKWHANASDFVSLHVGMFLWIHEEYFMTEYEWIILVSVCLYQRIWVRDLDLFIWFPAELLCCLTGTCTNSLNHGRLIDGVADFPLTLLKPVSHTPLMNANSAFFPPTSSKVSACSSATDNFCYVWVTVCQFWSLNLKWTLLREVFVQSKTGHWTYHCLQVQVSLVDGFRSSFKIHSAFYSTTE